MRLNGGKGGVYGVGSLSLTMTLGVEVQALVQFHSKARRWQSSTINVGIIKT